MIESVQITPVFATALSILPIMHYLDRVMLDDYKKSISGYILRTRNTRFTDFESAIINSYIRVFLTKSGDISAARVYALSAAGYLLLVISMALQPDLKIFTADSVWMILTILFLSTYISFPSDYFSIAVTKKIFYEKKRHPILLIPAWLIDTSVSLLGVVPVFVSTALVGESIDDESNLVFFYVAILTTCLISSVLSILQALTIVLGLTCRILALPIMTVVPYIFTRSKSDEYPLTVLALMPLPFLAIWNLLA